MRGDMIYLIPVKQEYRSIIKGMVHDKSASQALYIEPLEIVNLNNDLKNLQIDEKREINRILTLLTNMINHSNLLKLSKAIM